MTNEQKDNLFVLVKSLTKSEKRQFTLYVGRMDSNEDSKFLNLFQLLDKIKRYDEKLILKDLASRMSKIGDNADPEVYQTEIYQVGKDYKFENLRDWFKLIYQVLFGKDDGPRFGTFVAIYGVKETIKLINEKIN